MSVFWTVLLIILALILWGIIDFTLGKRKHDQNVSQYKQTPSQKSDALFFSQGDKLFDHIFQHIDDAKDHIHMQFYIFRDDHIGMKMLNGLKEKARQGVTVRLIVDWVGAKISKQEQRELKKAGVMFRKSNRPKFPFFFYSLNVRNHRKITVIDGELGYIGGYNIGDEYLGRDEKTGSWRDYHLFITGQGVHDLQKQFIKDWNDVCQSKVHLNARYFPPLKQGMLDLQIHPTEGAHVKEKLLSLMEQAKESVMIGTPYFIPGKEMTDHLLRYAKKGIRIQLLIPKYPDHPFVKDAAFPYFRSLLNAGVEIRQFKEGFYHSKVIVVDNKIVDIGTANFDMRSFHLNYEVNCIIHNRQWIRQIRDEIQHDFYNSSERITVADINKRTTIDRVKEKLATTFSPIL